MRTLGVVIVRYNNGMEELYDHDNDPHEWINLAGNPKYAKDKRWLHQLIRKETNLQEL